MKTETEQTEPLSAMMMETLNQNREAIKAKVLETMLNSIANQYRYDLPKGVQTIVDTFFQDEIAPAIKESLTANKDAIVEAATQAANGIALEVGKALQEAAAKKLSDSWSLREITKALFQ